MRHYVIRSKREVVQENQRDLEIFLRRTLKVMLFVQYSLGLKHLFTSNLLPLILSNNNLMQ